MMRKKDLGFTLVELMVVVAIITVALGITTWNLNVVQKYNAQGCARKLKSALELTRSEAMATGSGVCEVVRDTDGAILFRKSGGTDEVIGRSSVKVTYRFKNDATVYDLDGTVPTGKELKVSFGSSGRITDTNALEEIMVSGSHTYVITLYTLTGKATMEAQ